MFKAEEIADKAEVIIAGYAVMRSKYGFSVFDLNNCEGVAVFKEDGTLIETNMDDIELVIAKKRFNQSLKYILENAEVL